MHILLRRSRQIWKRICNTHKDTMLPTKMQGYPQRYKVTHKDTGLPTKIQGYPQRYRVTHKEEHRVNIIETEFSNFLILIFFINLSQTVKGSMSYDRTYKQTDIFALCIKKLMYKCKIKNVWKKQNQIDLVNKRNLSL